MPNTILEADNSQVRIRHTAENPILLDTMAVLRYAADEQQSAIHRVGTNRVPEAVYQASRFHDSWGTQRVTRTKDHGPQRHRSP